MNLYTLIPKYRHEHADSAGWPYQSATNTAGARKTGFKYLLKFWFYMLFCG